MREIKDKYKVVKEAKVGEECICPSCGSKFIKSNYQQAFCKTRSGTKCKDYYWNNVTETKRCNTTRMSPASKAWISQQKSNDYWDNDHPFSSDALGQWD